MTRWTLGLACGAPISEGYRLPRRLRPRGRLDPSVVSRLKILAKARSPEIVAGANPTVLARMLLALLRPPPE